MEPEHIANIGSITSAHLEASTQYTSRFKLALLINTNVWLRTLGYIDPLPCSGRS